MLLCCYPMQDCCQWAYPRTQSELKVPYLTGVSCGARRTDTELQQQRRLTLSRRLSFPGNFHGNVGNSEVPLWREVGRRSINNVKRGWRRSINNVTNFWKHCARFSIYICPEPETSCCGVFLLTIANMSACRKRWLQKVGPSLNTFKTPGQSGSAQHWIHFLMGYHQKKHCL